MLHRLFYRNNTISNVHVLINSTRNSGPIGQIKRAISSFFTCD